MPISRFVVGGVERRRSLESADTHRTDDMGPCLSKGEPVSLRARAETRTLT